jgi:hypothetical protein
MSCGPPFVHLPCTYKDATWDGLTWRITSTDSTEFDAVLSSAKFQLKDSNGAATLTLTSATAGQVTLNKTAARQWDITVESRILSLDAGIYSWALETTDADGVIKPRLIGDLKINADNTL